MAERRTRIMLSVPWDDESHDHPASWDWETFVADVRDRPVIVVDFEEVDENGNPAES